MAEGFAREAWQRTSTMIASLVNCHVTKRSEMRSPEDYNPFAIADRKRCAAKLKQPVSILKSVFIDNPRMRAQIRKRNSR